MYIHVHTTYECTQYAHISIYTREPYTAAPMAWHGALRASPSAAALPAAAGAVSRPWRRWPRRAPSPWRPWAPWARPWVWAWARAPRAWVTPWWPWGVGGSRRCLTKRERSSKTMAFPSFSHHFPWFSHVFTTFGPFLEPETVDFSAFPHDFPRFSTAEGPPATLHSTQQLRSTIKTTRPAPRPVARPGAVSGGTVVLELQVSSRLPRSTCEPFKPSKAPRKQGKKPWFSMVFVGLHLNRGQKNKKPMKKA